MLIEYFVLLESKKHLNYCGQLIVSIKLKKDNSFRVMRRIIFIVLSILVTLSINAQSEATHVEEKVYDVVEEMPQFPGGPSALFEYLSNNLQYPVVAEENGVQGRVIVTFIVEKDGSISNAKVVKVVDPSLDKEAIRLVESMPNWIPGKQNGEPVRVKYTVPVTFRL